MTEKRRDRDYRKSINVEPDVWFALNMIRLKNIRKYKTINDVVKALLEQLDEEEKGEK